MKKLLWLIPLLLVGCRSESTDTKIFELMDHMTQMNDPPGSCAVLPIAIDKIRTRYQLLVCVEDNK